MGVAGGAGSPHPTASAHSTIPAYLVELLQPRTSAEEPIVVVSVPARRRRASVRDALARDLALVERLAVVGPSDAPSHLVPLRAGPVRYALGRIPGGRHLGAVVTAVPGWPAVLERLLPNVAYVARRRSSAALADAVPLVQSSWLGEDGAAIVVDFDGAQPTRVAKVAAAPRIRAEERALATVAPSAARAGVEVPRAEDVVPIGDRAALLERPLEGLSAARVLAQSPRRLEPLLERLASWLEAWAAATQEVRPLGDEALEAAVHSPARDLCGVVERGYLDWLAGRAGELAGTPLPHTAAHNDLTMWNVLLPRTGRLGILDWEAAQAAALPLGDLVYAAVDAVAATNRYRSRPAAFAECFLENGARRARVGRLLDRLIEKLDLEHDAALFCFHACWLRHAANEARRRPGAEETPFLEILRMLSSRPGVGLPAAA